MFASHIYWIFLIWFSTGIIGFVSLPACRMIFKFSSDKGYAFSKIIGWFAVSYIAFLIATLKLMPLPTAAILGAVILWTAFNFYLFLKKPGRILPHIKSIIITEVIFILAFSGILLMKSFQPEVYQIERFMDYGFIQALRNSVFLPLQDIWLSGENLNYYYFGHFIGFAVLSITSIDTLPGFFLLTSLIFALLAAAIFRFSADFAGKLAGFLSVFLTLIAGTWYVAPLMLKKILFWLGNGLAPYFFYPEPTRIIPGTITEIPIYSFIVAEIHAHVWGMLSGILILAILYSLWRDDRASLDWKNLYFFGLAFILGASYMINSWDAATLGFLSVVVLAIKYWKKNKIQLLAFMVSLGLLAYAISLPWSVFYKAPVTGVGFAVFKSPFWPWLSFWGSIITIVLAYSIWKKSLFSLPGIIMHTGVFFIILMDLIYVKDILFQGEWYRANTVFKITQQVWLWISVFAGPVFVWVFNSFGKKPLAKTIFLFALAIYILIASAYPAIAIQQASIAGKQFTGIQDGLGWWQKKYPDDYEAYLFLENFKKSLPQDKKMKIIAEAEGDSYTDVSRFSVFLGWPAIVGWPVHEWTWRGSYEEVGRRRDAVREIYTGFSAESARALLNAYNVDYIIVGQVEKERYGGYLKLEKLRNFGRVIFEAGDSFIVEYSKQKKVCFGVYCFNAELALTLEEHAKGLIFRDNLGQNDAMLFVFEEEAPRAFWMKDTLIPLDIIWLNQEKEVVFIGENMQPCLNGTCQLVKPSELAKYVLELNAGTSDKIGLKLGDKMNF